MENSDLLKFFEEMEEMRPKIPNQLDGLPPFKAYYPERDFPPSFTTAERDSLALSNSELRYSFGPLKAWFGHHSGEDIKFSDGEILKKGDYYLDFLMEQRENLPINELNNYVNELVGFLEKYPKIDWLIGVSWLAGISNGKVVKRWGFKVSDELPLKYMVDASIESAKFKPNPSSRYLDRIKNPEVKIIYSSREDFLDFHHNKKSR